MSRREVVFLRWRPAVKRRLQAVADDVGVPVNVALELLVAHTDTRILRRLIQQAKLDESASGD